MDNMRQRILRGDIEAEKTEAINVFIPPIRLNLMFQLTCIIPSQAMCDIAADRARKLA